MFPTGYFDAGYWAAGYWGDDAGEALVGSVTVEATLDGVVGRVELVTISDTGSVELRGTLDGATGRVLLTAGQRAGGGGGFVRRQDLERMERHLRESKVRMRGRFAGVSGRVVLQERSRAALFATLEGVAGRVAVRHTYAAEIYEEDEDWLVLL